MEVHRQLASEDRVKIQRIADAMFAQQCELAQIPKMAAGVVWNGELVGCFVRNCDENSLFRIASMSKSFTAAAVLLLRDEGTIVLDSPVSHYVAEFAALSGPTTDGPPITVRHLLTMASGLSTDDPWADRHLDISRAELDSAVQSNPAFARDPGTGFQYSNLGYGVLGRVIEAVSGRLPQTFISERLLIPLGMHHSVWEVSNAPIGADVVLGTRADGGAETTPGDGGMATMGGLWSTVSDLAKWIGMFTDAYPPRNDAERFPLRRSSLREMQSMHTFCPPVRLTGHDGAAMVQGAGYGMGLFVSHEDATGEVPGHSGGLPGYGSNMRWVKGTPFGVVALANVTYAPMVIATARTLQALFASKVVRKAEPQLSTHLTEAAQRLATFIASFDESQASSLFSDNVGPDQAFAARKVDAAKLIEKHGALVFARVEPQSFAEGDLVLHSHRSEVRIPFSLAPNGKIQHFEFPSD
jgi:CubicO group peptidase (beta-lactamase class C family)